MRSQVLIAEIVVLFVLLCTQSRMFAADTIVAKDVFQPAPAESIRLSGLLGQKIDQCIQQRLLVQDIQPLVAPYRQKSETGSSDWRCEYWGKWYTSLALADAYHSTDASRALRDLAVTEMIHSAAPDGYLGTRQPADRLKGWDVWGQKYTLLGLMADYDRTANPAVLEAARRHADVLITELGPGGKNIEDVGEWNGLPASSVLEPVVQLYERSGDVKYLAFAEYIVACWDKPSARVPGGMRLVQDALAGKNPTQMCAPKAYELMSCFEGLCELYRATGKAEYRDAAVALCDQLTKNECTLVGCGTSGEVFYDGLKKQTGVVSKPMETCVTATWMKLNYQLLRETGDEKYAEELEKNLYNGLLGAMMPDGRWWAYFSGLMGVRVPSYIQHNDVGLSCCVVNGPRGLMITPFWAFMNTSTGPVINLYASGIANLSTPDGHHVKLEIKGDYPVGDHVEIEVNPSEPGEFALSLRIPAWSGNTTVLAGVQSIKVQPGSYVKLNRRWVAGDKVSIVFDLRGTLVESPDGDGKFALRRGPMVLSLDNRLNPPDAAKLTINRENGPYVLLIPNETAAAKIGAWMAFDVKCRGGEGARSLTFCEYAAAGNAFSQQNMFRTWLPQPVDLTTVFKTRQTWNTLSHAPAWTNPPTPSQHVTDPPRDLALALNGATATADSEYGQSDSSVEKVNDGIISGKSEFENQRWHSSVNTPHPHWVQITLARPTMLASAVIHAADPAGYAVTFEGQVKQPGQTEWVKVFRCESNDSPAAYTAHFDPVSCEAFRIVIEKSANPLYPNAAQLSEIELYAP